MTRKPFDRHLECTECGQDLSSCSIWLDDGGILCRECVVIRGYLFKRRKGRLAKTGEISNRDQQVILKNT